MTILFSLLTILISLATFSIAFSQMKIASAKNRLDLYNKRFNIYVTALEYFQACWHKSHKEIEENLLRSHMLIGKHDFFLQWKTEFIRL